MFTLIPTSVARVMSKRRVINLHADDSTDHDDEESEAEKPQNVTTIAVKTPEAEAEDLVREKDDIKSEEIEVAKISEETDENENRETSIAVTLSLTEENEKRAETPIQAMRRRMSELATIIPLWKQKSYKKVQKDDEETKEKEESSEKEKKEKDKKGKGKKSRLDVSSLKSVTRRMHFSYLIAIAGIVAALLTSYLIVKELLEELESIASDIQLADARTQIVNIVAMDLSVLSLYNFGGAVAEQYVKYAQEDIDELWYMYNNVPAQSYQYDLLYSATCLTIQESECPNSTYPYYDIIDKGFDYALFNYLLIAGDVLKTYLAGNTTLDVSDSEYLKLRAVAEIILDSTEKLTFLVYENAMDKISRAKFLIGVVTGVTAAVFILIYIMIFRPFVKKLRSEIEHTFSLIRMIPRKHIANIPEIQEFLQETMESD